MRRGKMVPVPRPWIPAGKCWWCPSLRFTGTVARADGLPSVEAAPPALAERLYNCFVGRVRQEAIVVETGQFRAMMAVGLVNDGPVTLILDSTI